MRTPKVTLPEEDPATKAAREREERRAESARTEETQAWLLGATGRRNRRFGSLGGGGSIPIYNAPARGGSRGGGARGGGGGGFGGFCPAPWVLVTLADGSQVAAGDLRAGMLVRTVHETTMEPGVFPVEAVSVETADRWRLAMVDGREIIASAPHRLHVEGRGWVQVNELEQGDLISGEVPGMVDEAAPLDHGDVVRITVTDAHTYMTEGLLSHNAKQNPDNPMLY